MQRNVGLLPHWQKFTPTPFSRPLGRHVTREQTRNHPPPFPSPNTPTTTPGQLVLRKKSTPGIFFKSLCPLV